MGKRKHTLESVRQYFSENSCELLETFYINTDIPMRYRCSCGEEGQITFCNFRHGRRCQKCYDRRRGQSLRKSYDQIVLDCLERGLILITDKEEYEKNWKKGRGLNIFAVCKNEHTIKLNSRYILQSKTEFGYCRQCYHGERHHWYKNGSNSLPKESREANANLLASWRKKVVYRDDYKCILCNGKRGLIAHHLNSYHWDIDNRFNVNNGITLCEPHHLNFHDLFTKYNNTKEQFDQYRSIIEECRPILEGQIGIPLLILTLN